MPDVINNVMAFLINTLIDIYLIVLVLRVLLELVEADFYNPLSQFVVSLSDPVLKPLRRFFPAKRGIDIAALIFLISLKIMQISLLALIANVQIGPAALVKIVVVQLLELVLYIYIFSLIAQAVLSWFVMSQGGGYHPLAAILDNLTRPVLRPIRRILPTVGMIDLSPMAALIGFYVLLIVLRSL